MTQAQKTSRWTISVLITIALLIWGASAWAKGNDTLDCAQTVGIDEATAKAIHAIETGAENRTMIVLQGREIEDLRERVDDLEHMEEMITDIYDVVVEGR